MKEVTLPTARLLSVLSITFGWFDFSAFASSNDAVNVLGVVLIVTIIVTSVFLIFHSLIRVDHLLVAWMINSYQRVKDQEWVFQLRTGCKSLH
jgi:fumarate reductase subunit D